MFIINTCGFLNSIKHNLNHKCDVSISETKDRSILIKIEADDIGVYTHFSFSYDSVCVTDPDVILDNIIRYANTVIARGKKLK